MTENFLDHGFVTLVDYMGDDYRVLQSARVSTGGVSKKGDALDRGLIRYLYKNKHFTPFEQVMFTFHAKVPDFVMKQYLRHRTFKTNEASKRYTEVEDMYYVPEEWRHQGTKNHQGSGESFDKVDNKRLTFNYKSDMTDTFDFYNELLDDGVAREMARIVLPSAVYTEFYFTVDLRNLFHFLELRLHEHAQYEIRVFAEAIMRILLSLDNLKWSVEIFDEMTELNWKIQSMLSNKIEPREIINILDTKPSINENDMLDYIGKWVKSKKS